MQWKVEVPANGVVHRVALSLGPRNGSAEVFSGDHPKHGTIRHKFVTRLGLNQRPGYLLIFKDYSSLALG